MTISDADIQKACEICGVEARKICPDTCWYENNNKNKMHAGICVDYNQGECLKLEKKYPTGLDLLDKLKAGLREKGSYYLTGYGCDYNHYVKIFKADDEGGDFWYGEASTELEALIEAILKMGEEQS